MIFRPIESSAARLVARRSFIALSATTVFLAACGATPIEVRTSGADLSEIAARKTYTHATADTAPSGYATSKATPQAITKIREEVDASLRTRGYVPAEPGAAQLVVRISAGTREVTDVPTGAAARAGASITTDTERGIVVDVLDASSEKILFHGYARYDADETTADPEKIHEAVTKLLADLPPTSAR